MGAVVTDPLHRPLRGCLGLRIHARK